MNASQPLLYGLNGKPMRLAGTTTLSDSPSVAPCLNKSRTSFTSHPSKPPMMGTRRLLPRSTNVTGKIAAKTQHPGPPGTPPATPTGRPEQPTAFGPQSPLTLPIPHPIFPWAEGLPAPTHPWGNVFPALVDSGASGTFVSNQLDLWCNDLDRPLKLQLFDGSPTTTRITQYHDNTLTLNNDLQFQVRLLVTQLPPPTPIMLRLPWLQDINPDIDWKDLTMQFPGPKASLAAAIPLRLQSIPDSDVFHSGASTSGATQSPSTSDDNPDKEEDATPPWSPSITLQWLPPNIPRNRYKGPRYPAQQRSRSPANSTTTPDSSATTLTSNSVDPGSLNIKIVSAVPFARLLQDSTPAFQLQIMPALPKEHLHMGTTALESQTEEQILSEVVSPEYHEFADMFSKGSAKELPPHCFYDHKIDLEEGTSPPFGKIYNMSKVELREP
ncbi:hypothetical protein E4T56_gene642 [Termitomyces sp. T112]|nr:hypothetical protein E4T56_gene642 [Termitomyces sp. T112]